jgi:hypothetical protein
MGFLIGDDKMDFDYKDCKDCKDCLDYIVTFSDLKGNKINSHSFAVEKHRNVDPDNDAIDYVKKLIDKNPWKDILSTYSPNLKIILKNEFNKTIYKIADPFVYEVDVQESDNTNLIKVDADLLFFLSYLYEVANKKDTDAYYDESQDIRNQIQAYRAGLDKGIPAIWDNYYRDYTKSIDGDYQEYLRLKAKFEGK